MCFTLTSMGAFPQWICQNPYPTSNALKSVYFTDASTGYAAGDYYEPVTYIHRGLVAKNIDGGTSWQRLSSGVSYPLTSVHFSDGNTGYVVGYNGIILKTTNGGVTFVEEQKSAGSVYKLFPNPVHDKISINCAISINGETEISVYDITGKMVMHQLFRDQNLMEMDVSTLAKTIYLVKIKNESRVETKKIVIL